MIQEKRSSSDESTRRLLDQIEARCFFACFFLLCSSNLFIDAPLDAVEFYTYVCMFFVKNFFYQDLQNSLTRRDRQLSYFQNHARSQDQELARLRELLLAEETQFAARMATHTNNYNVDSTPSVPRSFTLGDDSPLSSIYSPSLSDITNSSTYFLLSRSSHLSFLSLGISCVQIIGFLDEETSMFEFLFRAVLFALYTIPRFRFLFLFFSC